MLCSSQFFSFSVSDLFLGSGAIEKLRKLIGVGPLTEHGARIKRNITGATFSLPSRLLKAQLFVDRVQPNALAPYLNPLYEMFFRADEPEKIQLIIDQAYVDTAELREYDQVLHALLKQVERRFDTQPIQTDRSREYTLTPELSRYENDMGAQGRLHLVIGSRGAGKSLFIARFFSHLLPYR